MLSELGRGAASFLATESTSTVLITRIAGQLSWDFCSYPAWVCLGLLGLFVRRPLPFLEKI